MADVRFEAVGRRIRDARTQAGFTQEQLAKKLEVDRSAISLMEQGKREVSSIELRKLSEALGFPMDFFIPDEEDDPSADQVISQVDAAFRADSRLGEDALETLAWARLVLLEYLNLKRLAGEANK